jgi:hypothetical protein
MEQVDTPVKQNRAPRAAESREAMARPTMWKPPEMLPSPDPRPGITHRWIRVSMMGTTDAPNISSKFREGFEPCKADEYPELMMHAVQEGRFKGNIEHGGLLLCAIPTEFLKQREAHYANINKAQSDSVENNYLRDRDARSNMAMIVEKRSKVSFGSDS